MIEHKIFFYLYNYCLKKSNLNKTNKHCQIAKAGKER